MSMRTWNRKMAHERCTRLGIKHVNRERYFQGKRIGSRFAENWRKFATLSLPKPAKRKKVQSNG